jgi:hypothetical protein
MPNRQNKNLFRWCPFKERHIICSAIKLVSLQAIKKLTDLILCIKEGTHVVLEVVGLCLEMAKDSWVGANARFFMASHTH